jgi:hypothetical protein
MKKMIFMAAMLMAAAGMQAQEESKSQWAVKPMVGATYSKVFDSNVSNSYRLGVAAGAEVLFQPKTLGGFSVSSGILYATQKSAISDVVNGSVKYKFEYLNVPLLLNYEVVKGLKVKAGVQLGFRLNAKYDIGEWELLGYAGDVNAKDMTKPLYFSIPVGLSYNFPFGLVADFRYNIGVTNVLRSNPTIDGIDYQTTGSRGHHSTFMLTLGYQINL